MIRYRRVILSFVILALAAILSASCSQPEKEVNVVRPVKTFVVGDAGQLGSRVFPGTVRAAQRAQLSFRVSGPLIKLPISEGQTVSKGQLLAQIDPRDYQTAVDNLEARLGDLDAQLSAMQSARPEDIRRLEAMLAGANSRLLEAGASFRRYQRLYENNNVSKAEFDQSRAARDVAEAEVRSAEESLQIARSGARPEDLEAMEARIRAMKSDLKQAQDGLRDTELRAPYAGIVAERFVENFEYVTAFRNVLSLQDITIVEIVAQIPESVAAQARRENLLSFKARFPSIPGSELDATPTEFSTEADPVTRTYSVTFQTGQPENSRVFAGMTAEIEITGTDVGHEGFLVPVTAVFGDDARQKNVWVLDEGANRVRKVQVQVGEPSGDGIWVLAGLEAGQTVVTAGTHFISEELEVRPITDELRERK